MYYCGIDIVKRKHDVIIINATGDVQGKPLTIPNTQAGYDELQKALSGLEGPVVIGMESTGHYWLTLSDALSQSGYQLSLINPVQVAAYRKSGVRKVKNDRKDAWWIADYIRITNLPPTNQKAPILLKLRDLTRFRNSLVQQVGNLKRKVISILDRVFPEYETLFSNIFIQSSRALLQEAATAEEIAAFDLSELTAILNKSIPDIGPVTGALILGEIGDINRFEGSEQLVAYAGIDASVYETGQFKADHAHMSKRGSPHLRQAIWQAATVAARHDPELKAYYQKKRKEGKAYGVAIGAVCRKLIARIFIILKEQRPYIIRDC